MPDEDSPDRAWWDAMPVFPGVSDLVGAVRGLADRPRHGRRSPLPTLCLVGPPSHATPLLATLQKDLREDGFPQALVDLEHEAGEVSTEVGALHRRPALDDAGARADRRTTMQLCAVLLEAVRQLDTAVTTSAGRLRFPRFHLAAFLLALVPHPHEQAVEARHRERGVLDAIRRRGHPARVRLPQTVPEDPSASWAVLTVALVGLPWLAFRARVSGRFGGVFRWFLRQPYLKPATPTSFPGFAGQLVHGAWKEQSQEQVRRLLVNAFLADLRHAYRRSWRRPLGRRRMTHPVVLVDHAYPGRCGYELLRTVNDVRNGVGHRDPLVLVVAVSQLPASAVGATARSASDARQGLTHWREDLPRRRRLREPWAWSLFLGIAPTAGAVDPDEARRELRGLAAPAPTAPVWSRQSSKAAVGVVLLALAVAAYVDWTQEHCGEWWPGWPAPLYSVTVGEVTECVGTTDGSYDFLGPGTPHAAEVTERIRIQNEEVEARAAEAPGLPAVTVVYLSDLSREGARPDKREELAGLAVAQEESLRGLVPLRIVIANAGPRMVEGVALADRIADLAAADPALVGVVGLSESRAQTRETIRRLAGHGLPVVAATLSADEFAGEPLYFQVAPQNRRQAQVGAAWVADLRDRGIAAPNGRPLGPAARIVSAADPTDLYSANLAADLEDELRRVGFDPRRQGFSPAVAPSSGPAAPSPGEAGAGVCGTDGPVFFVGRGSPDFGRFLGGLRNCPGGFPLIVGGDDVTRYVADGEARRDGRVVPFAVLSFSVEQQSDSLAGRNDVDFYRSLRAAFGYQGRDPDPALDGHAALAHDAVGVFVEAVTRSNRSVPVGPGYVVPWISDIRSAAPGSAAGTVPYFGATGRIEFGGDVRQRVPVDKPVFVLRIVDGTPDPSTVEFCGVLGQGPTAPLQAPWCAAASAPG